MKYKPDKLLDHRCRYALSSVEQLRESTASRTERATSIFVSAEAFVLLRAHHLRYAGKISLRDGLQDRQCSAADILVDFLSFRQSQPTIDDGSYLRYRIDRLRECK